jgi:hypothetical protein
MPADAAAKAFYTFLLVSFMPQWCESEYRAVGSKLWRDVPPQLITLFMTLVTGWKRLKTPPLSILVPVHMYSQLVFEVNMREVCNNHMRGHYFVKGYPGAFQVPLTLFTCMACRMPIWAM